MSESPLYNEHLILGAAYDDEEPLLAAPRAYGDGCGEREVYAEGAALVDLSGMACVLASGDGAEAFAHAACAGRPLGVGECAFGAVVTGDGTVTSVPLVARTGDEEYLLCDPSERGLMLMPWLGFLAGIEQKGYRPFGGVSVEDVSESLHPLLMWGPQATAVLADYVPSAEVLPGPGTVANVLLDGRFSCLAIAPPVGDNPCYLLLVPPAAARVLWRSFLSFAAVVPSGLDALTHRGMESLEWMEAVLADDPLELALERLLELGLVRPEGGYVGARGLGA